MRDSDKQLLDAVFGPFVPRDDAWFETLTVHSHVDHGDAPTDDIARDAALQVMTHALIQHAIHQGLHATPAGWSLYEQDGRTVMAVLVLPKQSHREAA